MTSFPTNGFGLPCSSECSEFNAKGCPGNSPFCVTNPFERFEGRSAELEQMIEAHRDECKTLIANHAPSHAKRDLLSAADDRAFAALKAMHSLAHVADETNSLSRPYRVTEEVAS